MRKPLEIEVPPLAVISSIPALISVALYEKLTRRVAAWLKDTTPKRAASSPRVYWLTWLGA
eukprot:scaffold30918_cov90-Phaeocystis_antarctica.AAC.1